MSDTKEIKSKIILKNNPNNINQNNKPIANQELNIIDNYVLQNPLTNERILNSIQIDCLFTKTNFTLDSTEKLKLESKFNEHLLIIKKSNFDKQHYPCLINFYKPIIKELEEEEYKNKPNYLIYYIFRVIESFFIFENLLFDLYKIQITKNEFNITHSMKEKITADVKESHEYTEFINNYSAWHAKSEIIIFSVFLLDEIFKKKFNYIPHKFSLEKNLNWSVNEFAARNFAKLSSTILKNVELGVAVFGSVNYSRIFFLVLSNYYAGMSVPSIFFSTSFCHAALVGTYVFSWIVGTITSYLDYFKNTQQYFKMSNLLIKLNSKLDNICSTSSDLLKLIILSELHKNLNEGDEGTEEKVVNQKQLDKKVEEFSYLIDMHLGKIDDLTDKDFKLIEEESVEWIEKIVNVNLDEENGKSICEFSTNSKEALSNNGKSSNNDWILIDIIKDHFNKNQKY